MDTKILKQRIIFRRLIQALVILAIFLMGITRINAENDLYWQLKMGEQIWVTHTFPTTDPYNFSNPGAVWTLEEWLVCTLFYVIYSYFGAAGLILIKVTVISLTFGLFLNLFNRLKINLYLSLIVLFLAAMVNTRGMWTVFPSVFEYLFIALTLVLLESYQTNKKKIIPIFLAFFSLIWVQAHASFFLLSGIIGAYLFGDIVSVFLKNRFSSYKPFGTLLDWEQRKALAAVLIVSLVTPFISPNGYWTAIYPFRITFGKFTPYVSEYQKFWLVWQWNWGDFVHGFTFILMAILALVFLFCWKKVHIRDVFLGGIFALLALTAVRHVAIFALVALFLIARYLKVWFGEYRGIFKRSLVKDMVVIILIISFLFFYKTRMIPFSLEWVRTGYPEDAANLILSGNLQGNMFNHYNYGGYLIWKMSPKYKVFIDGRLEMYEGKAGEDYQTILYAEPGYKELLEKYQINFFLLYATDPIIETLVVDDGWRYVFYDSQYVIFVKNAPINQEFLAKYYSKEKADDFKSRLQASARRMRSDYFIKEGVTNVNKKDLKLAMEDFTQAVAFDPDYPVARIGLARAYLESGLIPEAIQQYQIVQKMDPGNTDAQAGLDQVRSLLPKQK